MKIRPYQLSDHDALVDLWESCDLVVPHNNPDRDIERKLRVTPDWFVVGTVENSIVASCMLGYDGHRGWINYLAVSPDHQRKGFASQLMRYAEDQLRAQGCPKLNLQIRSSNAAVREFYQKLGYTVDPVISMGKRLISDL